MHRCQLKMNLFFFLSFYLWDWRDKDFGNVKCCCCNCGQLTLHFTGTNLLQARSETAQIQLYGAIKKNRIVPLHFAVFDNFALGLICCTN